MYRVFSNKYSSIKTAKVILDSSGFSKGYGFVRFGVEEEQKSALYEMNGYLGLGSKALKICNAVPKPKSSSATTSTETPPAVTSLAPSSTMTDFSQYYDPSAYWQNPSLYSQTASQTWATYDPSAVADYTAYYQQQATAHIQQENTAVQQSDPTLINHAYGQQSEDLTLIGKFKVVYMILNLTRKILVSDHKINFDVEKMNREILERDRNFYDALESSKWLPIEQLELF